MASNMQPPKLDRRESGASEDSQTAADFINSQLRLEAEAREALPYKFDTCTRDLGPLRQLLFSCLTCNPPPANDTDSYTPAAVCYSCSVSCHGEHKLVELFHKRNFVCDCGTTRLPSTAPCTLRANDKGKKGVTGETPVETNEYNQNFRNKFCGCEGDYDAEEESSTMYQCMGLKGGCGEDWWHSTCVVGLDRSWYEQAMMDKIKEVMEAQAKATGEGTTTPAADAVSDAGTEEDPVPPEFPNDNDFEAFVCYKCVEANPWIKKYAGAPGFLEPVFVRSKAPSPEEAEELTEYEKEQRAKQIAREAEIKAANGVPGAYKANYLKTGVDFLDRQADREIERWGVSQPGDSEDDIDEIERVEGIRTDLWNNAALKEWDSDEVKTDPEDDEQLAEHKWQKKMVFEKLTGDTTYTDRRKAKQEEENKKMEEKMAKVYSEELSKKRKAEDETEVPAKKAKIDEITTDAAVATTTGATGSCKGYTLPTPPASPFSLFLKDDFRDHLCRCKDCFPKLSENPFLLEEEESYEPPVSEGSEARGGSSAGSLFERGEAALNSMDRVKAIEGVMAFNKLKEKLTPFFREFAESGKAISAEDIKEHFAKMRGDDTGKPKEDAEEAVNGDARKEGEGY